MMNFFEIDIVIRYIFKNKISLLCFAVILYAFYYYVHYKRRHRRLEKMMEQFQGPPGIPILGNALDFLKSSTGILKMMGDMLVAYNGQYRFWLADKPFIVIATPEDFEIVAHRTLERDINYKFISDIIGDCILTAKVEKWKRNRRIITSAFNPLVYFDHFLKVFTKQDRNMMKQLCKEVGTGKHFDLWPYALQTSIHKICETALGYVDKEGETEVTSYSRMIIEASALLGKRFYHVWLHPSLNFTLYKYLRGYGNMREMVQELPMKVLKKRKENLKQRKSESHPRTKDEKELRDSIDVLLNTEGFTDEDICAEITVLMLGGSETTALTTCYTILMLGIEQDIQDRVYREIFQVFGDSDRLPEQCDLNRLPYLEQCIKETMRKFSPVAMSVRSAHENTPISNGKIIPAGASVVLCVFGLHNNPNVYPNPEIWDPSNFDPDKVANRHKCSFVAFSTGPRGCIGQKYALLSLKAQISTLLRNFKVTTDVKPEDLEFSLDILIRSIRGYHIKLEYRHGKSLF